ncbi:hypothetical protein FA95DRAFT_1552708 [Auriscalpium vulgare]|uniref:Uncharacterized protein n=1 Tax=Auriscalpium vulgare TaxID=40419 RepID=A0ACB8SAN9_9AGAM|nr:hypothetical protein FA95DRAFT_1552708 [Auriscalpium vulgare]
MSAPRSSNMPFFAAASAPSTPAYTTRPQQPNDGPPPVTPQRIPRAQRHHTQLQNYFQSPITPASTLSTPYTPLSLRSSWGNSSASALTTPSSVASAKRNGLASSSPKLNIANYENAFGSNSQSRADTLEDWRSRANENGIRVGAGREAYFGDEVLSAPAILTQRRSRAQTLVHQAASPSSPQVRHDAQPQTPARRTLATLNTPPPRASNINLLKLKGSFTDPAYPRRRPAFGQTDLFDIHEDAYAPYPDSFTPSHSLSLPLSLNDPFDAPLPTISEAFPQSSLYHLLERNETPPPRDESSCSVCGNASSSLAELEPCSHVLCSACLTSALNIVGEKDMECAVCKKGVANFQLRSSGPKSGSPSAHRGQPRTPSFGSNDIDGLMNPFNFFDVQRASTPNGANRRQVLQRPGEFPVLRIDNVPWDITPPAIAAWLKHPTRRVHVLLDRKGKTLSHAYVEMADEDAARAALRTAQNSVLGKGKRARGVTVTRSGQEELMKALFPSWQGSFDGSRPSIAGLSNEHVIAALEHGLLTESELKSLLHLIRSPDSHFLKVPSLPYHSLIGVLSKFPSDADSRLFWSGASRDMLFAAIRILASGGDRMQTTAVGNDPDILSQILEAAFNCDAFTGEQRQTIANLVDTSQAVLPHSPASSATGLSSRGDPHTPDSASVRGSGGMRPHHQRHHSPFGGLAQEFGVEPQLIEALAQRLSGMSGM